MVNQWDEGQKKQVLATLSHQLLHGSEHEARDAARRWGAYEESVMRAMSGVLASPASHANEDAAEATERMLGKYRLQAHYLSNACFTTEQQLLEFAGRLQRVPAIIIHGTHDLVCPPENAVKLAAAMPHAQLRWVSRGGHTPADTGIALALRNAVQALLNA
jgi:proline iminopeptidase